MVRIQNGHLEEESPAVPFAADNLVGLSHVHMGHAQLVQDFRVVRRQSGRPAQGVTCVQSPVFQLQVGLAQSHVARCRIFVQLDRTLERNDRLAVCCKFELCHASPVVRRSGRPVLVYRLLKQCQRFLEPFGFVIGPSRFQGRIMEIPRNGMLRRGRGRGRG